jgi:hypothetical protein
MSQLLYRRHQRQQLEPSDCNWPITQLPNPASFPPIRVRAPCVQLPTLSPSKSTRTDIKDQRIASQWLLRDCGRDQRSLQLSSTYPSAEFEYMPPPPEAIARTADVVSTAATVCYRSAIRRSDGRDNEQSLCQQTSPSGYKFVAYDEKTFDHAPNNASRRAERSGGNDDDDDDDGTMPIDLSRAAAAMQSSRNWRLSESMTLGVPSLVAKDCGGRNGMTTETGGELLDLSRRNMSWDGRAPLRRANDVPLDAMWRSVEQLNGF